MKMETKLGRRCSIQRSQVTCGRLAKSDLLSNDLHLTVCQLPLCGCRSQMSSIVCQLCETSSWTRAIPLFPLNFSGLLSTDIEFQFAIQLNLWPVFHLALHWILHQESSSIYSRTIGILLKRTPGQPLPYHSDVLLRNPVS
jgi:hypothetical protein